MGAAAPTAAISRAAPARPASVWTNSGRGQSSYQVHDEDVTAATVDYLNRLGVKRRAGVDRAPFSISVGFMLPHQPFVARREDYELYEGRITMPRTPEPFREDLHPHIARWRQATGTVEISDEEILRARTAYWALVTRMDAMIGEILEALRRNDLAGNTLIVYTSDHGEQVGEARPVVEADFLRRLGEGAGHTLLARRPAARRAL